MPDAADRLFAKLREFTAGLDPEERALFSALVAPGVASAYDDASDDVTGFSLDDEDDIVMWSPQRLPDALADVIRDRDVRVEGLG